MHSSTSPASRCSSAAMGLDEAQVLEVLRLPDEAVTDALGARARGAHALVRAGGRGRGDRLAQDRRLPGGLPLLLAVGPLRDAGARRRGSTSRRSSRRRRETAATGATEFCIVAAVRGPDAAADGTRCARASRRSQSAVDINVACSLGILTPRAGGRARRDGRAPLQPQPRDRALATSRKSSPRTPGRSAGRRCSSCASAGWRSAAAASSGWARRSSSAPSSPRSSPRSSPTRCR